MVGKMRNPSQNARLQQARGQLFICGIFGNCASSVLSPRTPPAIPEFEQQQEQQQQPIEVLLRHCEIPVSGSPSTSASDAGNDCCNANCSTATDARSSVASDFATDMEELLAEIKAGNVTTMTVSSLRSKLGKDCLETSRELVRSSGVASSLITLLLSSDLSVTLGGARESVDERHVPHVLEESLAALAAVAEFDEAAVREMASSEFLAVVMWYVNKGRKEARESACLLLEKLSLEESFKGIMGASDTGVMEALNEMLRDEKQLRLVKLATRTLLALCLLRDNRYRAVEVGVVASLIEMLPRARSASAEKALATLELLGTTEEGKTAMIEHALAVPVLVELILKVSDRGTEYATGTLSSMCSDSMTMREAAVAHGAPTKLLLLIQSDCTARAKRKASQLLKALHKLWVEKPCNPDCDGTLEALRY